MGALTTIALVPNLIFSLHAGSWVDRRAGRRQVMLVTDILRGLLIATVPIAYALGHLTWIHLYIVAFGTGTLSVFFYVAYGGFFQTIVRREDYVAANSLSHGSRAFSFLAGTSLGGVLVQILRGPYALALDAVSYVWSAFFMSRVDAPDPPHEEHSEGGVLAGARWIRGNAIIRAELLGVATLNLFNFIYFALFLLYATRSLHVRPGTLGVVLGVASIGTLFGSVVTARISRRIGVGPAFLIGCFLFPAPLILVPAAGGPHWLVVVLLFTAELLSGFGLMLLDILAGAMSAAVIPPQLRSRVSGAFMVVNNGVRPVGTALGGVLGSTIGLRPTLWIATVGALGGMFFLLPSPIRSMQDVPDEAEA
jgi:MFS family permease